jgi:hypothetical protein
MASWIEINRVRKDSRVFKPLAGHLLANTDHARERSDSATDFLENVSHYRSDELTTRQGEFLLELRDEARVFFKIGDGLSVEILIEKCFLARLELSNDDDIVSCTRFRRHRVRCFMEQEVCHGETSVYARVQA